MPDEPQGSQTPVPDTQTPDAAAVGNMVNAAVKQHIARALKNEFPALIAEALKPVMEQVSAIKPAPPPDEGTANSKNKQTPEHLALQKQFEDLKESLAKSEKARTDAENKARDDRAYAEVRAGLEGKVRPELLDIVTKNLFYVDKRVEFDETTGATLFKAQRSPFLGADPEDVRLPLRAGLDEYMKGESAKAFLPAPASSGASPLPKRTGPVNQTIVTGPQTGGTDAQKIERAKARAARARAAGAQ